MEFNFKNSKIVIHKNWLTLTNKSTEKNERYIYNINTITCINLQAQFVGQTKLNIFAGDQNSFVFLSDDEDKLIAQSFMDALINNFRERKTKNETIPSD